MHRLDCNAVAPVNAIVGKISESGKAINVCVEDVAELMPEDFTNGAEIAALNDGETYKVTGDLKGKTFNVTGVEGRDQ